MILIGILGLCIVIFLYVLLYLFFIRRTNRFMDAWEKEIKEKIEKVTKEGILPLEEAAEAIKASREAMESFALEKGLITKPAPEESSIPEIIIETQAEPMASPTPSYYLATCEHRKRKEWENWVLVPEPTFS
jgi:F0F1-type ATP synthase membrane subunit b/b'